MKGTRQRCQLAPWSNDARTALRPWWASRITSFTPLSPRATRLRRNSFPNGSSSERPTSKPSPSRSPVSRTPVATT